MCAMFIANLVFYHCALVRSIPLQFTEKWKTIMIRFNIFRERERERERNRVGNRDGFGGGGSVLRTSLLPFVIKIHTSLIGRQ